MLTLLLEVSGVEKCIQGDNGIKNVISTIKEHSWVRLCDISYRHQLLQYLQNIKYRNAPQKYRGIMYDTFSWLMGLWDGHGSGHPSIKHHFQKIVQLQWQTYCAAASWLCPSGHPRRQKIAQNCTKTWEWWNKSTKYHIKYRDIWSRYIEYSNLDYYRSFLLLGVLLPPAHELSRGHQRQDPMSCVLGRVQVHLGDFKRWSPWRH